MPIPDVVSLVVGAALGAPFSEILKLLIEEVKKVKDFKPLSHDLASTMERLVPHFQEIELMQGGFDPSRGELKFLIKTMQRAEEMILKCSRVHWCDIRKRNLYTTEIKGIKDDILKFCQIDLQLIQLRNQLQFRPSMPSVSMKVDLLSDTRNKFAELFVVPQPETVTIFWLNRPSRELKKMLFEDRVVSVVVSAPYACGKTMLVTKLCHDADVRGKFKQIFFITVSKAPNARLIVQRLLQRTGCKANEFADNLDGTPCIQQLLKQLGQSGSILLVLDDVWPEEESLLQKFLIKLPDYKILVTSRFEFPRIGPTFYLEPLIDDDIKNLFTECALQSNRQSFTKLHHIVQKILKSCNGSPLAMNPPSSICDGCNSVIEHERLVTVLGVLWHPECFCCDTCLKPIAIDEVENHVSNSRGKFHKSCYKKNRRLPNCSICKEKIPSTAEGIRYNYHPFWKEKYCPSHEVDGTPECCSCERLEPRGTNYVMLGDGRWLCLDCMDSAVMNSDECQPLYYEMRDFFECLNMKFEKEFPVSLVEKQVLNKAKDEEKNDEFVIRGICLSEEQIVTSVPKSPMFGPNMKLIGLATESHRVVCQCEITAILILYGHPRIVTGYILAHEMMHAWLRLNGYRNLTTDLEEGICQVLAHMWLEPQMYATLDVTAADASSDSFSSSRTPPAIATSKKGDPSVYERKLAEFCKYQIENDDGLFGQGFKKVYEMMESNHYNLKDTLKDIVSISETPP